MANPTPLNPLNNHQKDVCTYGGVFGVLFSVTCIIQLMVFGTDHWLVTVLYAIYLYAGSTFFMLALQRAVAPLLLIVATSLISIAVIIWLRERAFSLLLVLFFIYCLVTVIYIHVEDIPKRLRQKSLALKAEEALWEGKI